MNHVKVKNGLYVMKKPKDDTTKILFVDRYKFFNEYKAYGYKTKNKFIAAYLLKQIPEEFSTELVQREEKEIAQKIKAQAYVELQKEKRKAELREQLKESIRNKDKIEIEISKIVDKKIYWNRITDLTSDEKNGLVDSLIIGKNEIEKVLKSIESLNNVRLVEEVYKFQNSIFLCKFFNIKMDKFTKCPFVKGHKSVLNWNMSKRKYYIYTFNIDSLEGVIMDFTNLLELYGIDLVNLLEIKLTEKKKFEKAIAEFDTLLNELQDDNFSERYPSLAKYIKSYKWFLEEMILFGKQQTLTNLHYIKNNNELAFFASCRYWEQYLQENNKKQLNFRKVSKLINLFCVLGFFTKLMKYNIPEGLRFENHKAYDMNYIQLNKVNLELAEERAKALIDNKIQIKSFRRLDIEVLFGVDLANKVFQQMKGKEDKEEDMDDLPF